MERILQRLSRGLTHTILLLLLQNSIGFGQVIRYVDASKSAGAGQDGTTWARAYPTLKAALDVANANPAITEIQVAKGTYYPTGEQSLTDRNASFVVTRGGLGIFGGYPSGGGNQNYAANPTLLSGDIGQLDVATDNSFHVMVIAGIVAGGDVTLAGLAIVKGRANGSGTQAVNGQNIVRNGGGGLVIWNNTIKVTAKNSAFSGNYASDGGAGSYIRGNAPTFINSLFSGNYANFGGGSINVAGSNTRYINCTFGGNHDNNGGGAMRNSASNPVILNTIIHSNSGGISNNSSTPVITYSLIQGLTGTISGNLNGNTVNPGFLAAIAPSSAPTVGGVYSLNDGSRMINMGSNDGYSNAGGNIEGDWDLGGDARVSNADHNGIIDIGAYEEKQILPDFSGKGAIRYVKPDGTGNGTSWAHASGDLQAMINASTLYDQVWVTKGTYKPNRKASNPTVVTPNSRDNSFVMKSGVTIYGGFNGTESALNLRRISENPTILSGDFNGDDAVTKATNGVLSFTNNSENAYHVVLVADATGVTLDGLTIKGGNANGSGSIQVNLQTINRNTGALISGNKTDQLNIIDCILTEGFASDMGGAIDLTNSTNSSTINTRIVKNRTNKGGGIAIRNTQFNEKHEVRGCTVSENNATEQGGGIFLRSGQITITNTVISGNYAINSHAGGVYAYRPETGAKVRLTMIGCQVTGNRAGSEGGGIRLAYYKPRNVSSGDFDGANATLYNCTISGNRAGSGGAIYRLSGYTKLTVENSILWGNGTELGGEQSNSSLRYSIIQDGDNTSQNSTNDPMFVEPVAFTLAPFIHGNFALQPCSFGINSGASAIPGLPTLDLVNNPRINGVVDRGAFEYNGNALFTTRYVRTDGNGNGSSWAAASGDLQLMINQSGCGDQIFIAKGKYYPIRKANDLLNESPNNRDNAFVLKSGLKVYGGFAGTESSPGQRNLSNMANRTTLSGDFKNDDQVSMNANGELQYTNNGENAYHVIIVPQASEVLIDGLTLSGGRPNNTNAIIVNGIEVHRNNGGGLVGLEAINLSIENCTFENNHASNYGGGINLFRCDRFTMKNSVIRQNKGENGGGMVSRNLSRLQTNSLSNCSFTDNNAADQGGGFYGRSGKFVIENSIISGNNALSSHGGGIYVFRPEGDASVELALTGCQITGNKASGEGGGLRTAFYYLQRHDLSGWSISEDVGKYYAHASITNCIFAGNRAGSGGAIYRHSGYGSIKVLNSIVWDNSSALSGGTSNVEVSSSIIQGGYEGRHNSSPDPLFISSPSFTTAPFSGGQYETNACSPAVNSGDMSNISLSSLDLAGRNRLVGNLDRGAYEYQGSSALTGTVRYVKAGGSGNGNSWGNASGDLQAVINASSCGDAIYVQKGVYVPNRKANAIEVISANHRDNAFLLKSQVKIYGGFVGTEQKPEERDLSNLQNRSVLSGDFKGDDIVNVSSQGVLTYTNNAENTYHVVVAVNVTESSLDGFVITGGRANSNSAVVVNGKSIKRNNGAGIIAESSFLKLENCIIQAGHASSHGGGLYGDQLNLTLKSSQLTKNKADYGGGLALKSGSSVVHQCIISENDAVNDGGGSYLLSEQASVSETRFLQNRAKQGGGVFNNAESNTTLKMCYVQGNRASAGGGGGLYNTSSSGMKIFNSLITGNRSSNAGGGIRNNNTATIVNCTLSGNYAGEGAGGIQRDNGNEQIVKNCIIFGNSSGVGGGGTILSSILESGATGVTLYSENPGFEDAPPFTSAPFTGGDFRTQNCWPVINTGESINGSDWIPDHDLIGNPRVVAAKIDLGVYESQNTATKKIFVKQGASGDGNSWASAMGDLQHAINASCAGDTIFVAAGTYKPQAKPTNPTENTPDHRDNAFSMKSFVAVYGGFKGTEKNLSERILPAVSGSILSGDFNGNDVITGTGFGLTISGNDENAYHVIAAVGVGALVIDGFVIQGGNASSDSEVNIKNNAIGRRNGGGILIESVDDVSIANCTIRYNKAVAIGAGIAAHWSTNVKIKNSTLTLNRANDGGALRMRGITGEIENTLITLNVASADGGGIYLSEKSSVLNITDTRISSNFAGADGGGGRISASTLRISGGNLNENRAENGAGGALFSRTNALIVINDATISNNYCKDNGGGIWNGGSGGESASQVYLTKVQMKGNIAGDKGGALYNYRASGEETAVLNHVEISANQAVYGGGIANSGNDASMVYSTTANHIFNSVISRNKASKDGGGIYNEKSNRSLLLNVTVANNEAKYGGGIYNNSEKCPPIPESDYYQCDDDKSSAYVQNSIVWGNQATGGAGIYEGSGRYVSDKRYSLVQGISSTAKGNLDASMTTPGFTDEANGDYSLKPGSSVINAGDNSLLSTSLQFDFLGNSRFAQFIVDMGAIEFQQNTTKHPIRYVKVGAAGAGTSWDDASGDLQAMINAPDVVQVWVTSGTYLSSGDGFFLKNNVAIYGGFPNSGNPAMSSRNWQQTPSILSGGNTRRVVFNNFPSGSPLTPTAILDGFVITEGNTGGNGGGMYNVNASPRLIHITFSNNKSTGSGGAMYNATSQPEITYTKFVNNTAGGNGGAIGNTSTSAPFILNCLFSGNSASSGGALSADNGSSYRLMNSTIAGNSASASGGGVYHAGSTTSPSIYSSIVYGNGTQIRNENQATAVTSYSVVEGGYTGTGNINANPKFVNSTASDYRLQADSPAINAGDTEAYGNLGRDLENDLDLNSSLRVFNELIDIGAYEFNGAAVFSTRYVKENGGGNGSSWATASGNLQAMINEEGVDEVWVAKGTYTSSGNGFKLKNNVAVYGGFSNVGNPGIEERDWVRNVTILSGGTQRRVFYNDFTPSKPLNNTSILDGFTITAGKGGNGAAMYNANAAPRLVHLTFLNNQSTGNGGAVYNAASAPFILNCRFKNNVASGNGGALCNASVSRPLLVNTVFSGNSASSGGAVYANNGSSYTMINSTITGNTDGVTHAGSTTLPKIHNSIIYATGVAIQNQSSAVTTVSYSFVEGGFSGIGNVDAAPEFENEAGGDYQLKPTSPAINGGSNVLLSGLVEDADQNTDVDGNFRIYDSSEGGAIDMGAFEFQGNPVYPAIRYVKAGAKGSGYSWGSASGDLQSAIDAPDVEQVWVAAGTYTPQSIVGTSDDERDKSFVLQNDVMIYGGFRGTEATLADRPTDFTLHRSILSGDLYQDDVQGNIQGINTYHVVISVNDVGTAELNGFTVRGGYTGKSGSGNVSLYGRSVSRERGGGISLVASSPKITNVIISGNIGYAGGAIANSAGSTPSLRNVLISDNTGDYGGGIYNNASSPVFINVTVARNKAIETNDQGVALRNVSNSYPKIFNSIIHGNTNVDGFVNNIFNSGGVTPTSIPEYMYSLVQGSNAGWSSFGTNGGHNIDGEPQFINSPEGDYRLLSNSAAVNGGNNGYTIAGDNTLTVDLMGNPRIQNGIIDMGAFEMACSSGLSESVVFTRKEISEGVNRFTAGCYYLATLVGEGDHQVSGFVSATSRLAPQNVISQQTARFVRRFYQLTAETNSAHATARVTLYFTKQDFKAYNDGYGQEAGFLLPVNPEDVVNTLKIVQYHGEGGEDGMPASPSATHSILNPSSVTWNSSQELWEITFSISGFSSFFITTQSNPLPVTLVDFTAKSVEQNVELTWHTTSEVDASHFEIEKSGNGKTWETLGTVDAHGAAAGNYAYTDASRLYNINYYRLKMVDMDGSYSYSRMVSVHNRDNARQMQVSIYPNPVSAGILTVSTSQAGTPVVTVYDLLGRKVKVPILKNIEGELGLDVSRLSAGIYIISVRKEEEEQVLRFVVH